MYSYNLTLDEELEDSEKKAKKERNKTDMAYIMSNASKIPKTYFFTQVNVVGNNKSLKSFRPRLFWKGYTEGKLSDLKTVYEIAEMSEQQKDEYKWFCEGYENKGHGEWRKNDAVINPEIGNLSFVVFV